MMTQQIMQPSTEAIPVDNHLFDEALHLTGVTEYGVGFEDLLSGRADVPPQGARFDIAYEGAIEGPILKGFIEGVDYIDVRGDGRFQLNIFARLTTDDGTRIAVTSDGLLKALDASDGLAQLRLSMRFSTASPDYAWMNDIQAWGTGTVNVQTQEVNVRMYEV